MTWFERPFRIEESRGFAAHSMNDVSAHTADTGIVERAHQLRGTFDPQVCGYKLHLTLLTFYAVLFFAPGYAQRKPCFTSGSERIGCPVAAKMALHTAGKIGGNAGSPSPVGEFLDFRK